MKLNLQTKAVKIQRWFKFQFATFLHEKLTTSALRLTLRLKYLNQLSNRQIQTITGVSRNSVANYVNCFIELEASLEDILELTEPDLEQLFHPNKSSQTAKKAEVSLIHPDWNNVRVELSKKGMTRALLYEEYKNVQPELYSYCQFYRYYAKFLKSINPSMRQVHYAGDKFFIDYSGVTMPIVDQRTGEISKAQIFVSVLGASGYTIVHATLSQSTKDFIKSHVQVTPFLPV